MSRLIRSLAPLAAVVLVAASLSVAAPATSADAATTTSAPSFGRFTPVGPDRVWNATTSTTWKTVDVAGVPDDATAVVMSVKVRTPSATGYVSVRPAGSTATPALQNFTAGRSVTHTSTVGVHDGEVQVRLSAGSAIVSFDLAGYYSPDAAASTFTAVPHSTVFGGTVGPASTTIPMAGRAGVPADATAVALDVQVAKPTQTGAVGVIPAGGTTGADTAVFAAGTTVFNAATVPLSGGEVQAQTSAGSATVSIEVVGYYSPSSSGSVFVPADPMRASTSTVSPTARSVTVRGTSGIPATATGVVVNAKVGSGSKAGLFRVSAPGASTIGTASYAAGQTTANEVIAPFGTGSTGGALSGRVSSGTATMYLDVVGYLLDGSSGSGVGADISYPQADGPYPSAQAFGIVGVNNGDANSTNPYFAKQLAWANGSAGNAGQAKAQLYVNTANPGPTVASWPKSNTYGGKTITDNPWGTCSTKSPDSLACGYMYGYARAIDDLTSRGVQDPTQYRWWLDVETLNTWQKDDLPQNRTALEGMARAFRDAGVQYGIYSTNYQWGVIAGTFSSTSTLRKVPNWIALGSTTMATAQSACGGKPLMDGKIAMTQYISGGYDRNVSCP